MDSSSSDSNDTDNRGESRTFYVAILVLAGLLITGAGAAYAWRFGPASGWSWGGDQNAWGTFGDFFGGIVNPALAFVGLLALLYTIHLQLRELGYTRKEMEKTREILEEQKTSIKEQRDIAAAQRRDAYFFGLLEQIEARVTEIHNGIDAQIRAYLTTNPDLNTAIAELGKRDDAALRESFKIMDKSISDFLFPKPLIFQFVTLTASAISVAREANDEDEKRFLSTIAATHSPEAKALLWLIARTPSPELISYTDQAAIKHLVANSGAIGYEWLRRNT